MADSTRSSRHAIPYVWPLAIVVAVMAIVVASWRLVSDVMPLALDAGSRLADIRKVSVDTLVDGQNDVLDDTQRVVEKTISDFDPAARYIEWLGRFAPALSWLPPLDLEIAAWTAQSARLRDDLSSASTLLSASNALLDTYDRSQAVLSGRATSDGGLLDEIARLASDFTQVSDSMAQSVGLRRRFGSLFALPLAADAINRLAEVEEQMLAGAEIGEQVSGLMVPMLEIGDQVRPLIAEFDGGGPPSEQLTFESLHKTLTEVEGLVQTAQEQSTGLIALLTDAGIADGRLIGQVEAVQQVLEVVRAVNQASSVAADVAEPALGGAQLAGGLLGEEATLVRILDRVAAEDSQIEGALSALDAALDTLTSLESSVEAPDGLEELADLAGTLRGGLQFVKSFAPVGRGIFGADSPTRYLVLGQSADELRATGGFVSSLWLVSFRDGALEETRYHDSVRVDDWDRLMLYPPAPSGLEEHMNARVWLLRDVSWEPDFPTAAATAEDMFRLGQRQDVDGVVAITQWTLLEIVKALGETPSPGGGAPITSRNLLSSLEQGTDEHGRAYVDLALQGVLDRLSGPMTLATVIRLASAVYGSLQEREMLVYLNDRELQAVVDENGWDGGMKDGPTDYLYVVDSNVGWSKSDRNVERAVRYSVDLRKEARPRASLTLAYNNHSGPGSPGCEPQWLNRGSNYGQLKNACYWNYFRVYIPQAASLLTSTSLPLPEYSVSVEIGKGLPGNDTVSVSSRYNRAVLSGLFALGAGERQGVDLVYDLPPGLVRREGNALQYSLLIQKQPGVRQRHISVELVLPPGYSLESSSIAPASSSDASVEFLIPLKQDVALDVRLARDADEPG